VHDLGLSPTRELNGALAKASYEVPEQLARLLGACPQLLGVPRVHMRAVEVPHERVDQVVPAMDLARLQVFEPCSG
jgi:hypothetical protein